MSARCSLSKYRARVEAFVRALEPQLEFLRLQVKTHDNCKYLKVKSRPLEKLNHGYTRLNYIEELEQALTILLTRKESGEFLKIRYRNSNEHIRDCSNRPEQPMFYFNLRILRDDLEGDQ